MSRAGKRLARRSLAELLTRPPAGCSVVSDRHRVTATISLRSLVGFVSLAGTALFWNGVTSIFVSVAIAGLYTNLIGPLPNWFTALGLKDGVPHMNGVPMDLGNSLFLCVFSIPFVTIGTVMAGSAIMHLIGKVEVVIDEFDSYVATGFGFLRWKRRFDPRKVQAVELSISPWNINGRHKRLIKIKSNRSLKFGSLLPPDRMEWLHAVLRQALLPRNYGRRVSSLPALAWIARKPL